MTTRRWILLAAAVLLTGLAFVLFETDLPAEEVDAKYTSPASRFLPLEDGARVHYRDEGRRNGPAVVLVHGSNASLHTWEPWVRILGDEYRIVTLDLGGHGLTGRTPGDDYSSEAYVATVDAVVDAVGLERFVLGGNSMGGGVTWRYALAHPERIQGLILIDASGPRSWWEEAVEQAEEAAAEGDDAAPERERPLAFQLLSQAWFRAVARYLDPYALAKQGALAAYNHSPVVTDELIDRYYELSMREGTRAATMARFARQRTPGPGPEALATLDQPTLVMWGAQDALIPVSVADRFEAALPNATKVVYDDLGHIPMEEDAVRSAADVRAFLVQVFGQGPIGS